MKIGKLLIVALIILCYPIFAAAPKPAVSINIHEINESLQKLKKEYDQANEIVDKTSKKFAALVPPSEEETDLERQIILVEPYFDELDHLIEVGYSDDNIINKKLAEADCAIESLYSLFTHQALIALHAKLEMYKAVIARYRIYREIKKILEDYKATKSKKSS